MADFGTPETWNMKVGQFIESKEFILPEKKPQEIVEQRRKERLSNFLRDYPGAVEPETRTFIESIISRDKPKRGLVDEPGKYSQPPKPKTALSGGVKREFRSKYYETGDISGLKPEVVRGIKLIEPVIKKYEEIQDLAINDPKGGTLKDFPDFKTFVIQEIDSVKNIKDANKLLKSTEYHTGTPRTRSEARKLLLDKLIEIENAKPGQSRPGFDLAVQAGYRTKTGKTQSKKNPSGSRTTTAPSGSFKNLLNNIQKQERRITQVFNDIDAGKISLDEIANEGGLTRYLNKPFGYNAPAVFDNLMRKKFKDRERQRKLLNNPGFLTKYKGRDILANEAETLFEAGRTGGKFSSATRGGPLKKIFEFADRHMDSGGDKIRYVDENSFIYDNKVFSSNPSAVDQRALKKFGLEKTPIVDLVTEGPKRKEFKEIYKAFDTLREYETLERPHPITGKQTPLTKLLQEADYIASGRDRQMGENIFKRLPFEIDHFGGVESDPFKNIRVIPRTLNQAAGQLARKGGYSTIKDIDKAEKFLGYKFTGNPIDSLNKYIDTEFQRGQDPNYTGRAKKIAGVKTKLIDEAIEEAGGTGTKGGQILTESLPEGIFKEKADPKGPAMLEKSMTQVPILEKTPEGKITMGSRPVTEKEVISVAERDAKAKSLARKILDLDLGFLPKKVSRPLELGQEVIRGFTRGKFSVGGALIRGAQSVFTPTGITALFGPPDPDLTEAQNRIALGLEAAFLKDLVAASVGATKGMKNRRIQKILQQALNLGIPASRAFKIARLVTPIGQLALAGEGVYQLGKFTKGRIKELEEMSDEEREDLRREADEFSFGEYSGAAEGGIMRLGLAEGPDKKGLKSPGRRKFMKDTGKLAGILALIPYLGKFIAPVAKSPTAVEGVKLGADKLMMLVDKIKKFGVDKTKSRATQDLQEVTIYQGKDGSEYELVEDLATGDIRVTKEKPGMGSYGDETFDTIEDRSVFEIKKGRGDETTKGTPPDEYDEGKEIFGPEGTVDDVDEIDDRIIKEIDDEIN